MLKVGRPGLTDAQRADMWRQWKAGYSIREISAVLHRSPSAVGVHLAERGGIAPPVRKRSAIALSMAEREEISRGLSCGRSL
jgi:hypothetical protein